MVSAKYHSSWKKQVTPTPSTHACCKITCALSCLCVWKSTIGLRCRERRHINHMRMHLPRCIPADPKAAGPQIMIAHYNVCTPSRFAELALR